MGSDPRITGPLQVYRWSGNECPLLVLKALADLTERHSKVAKLRMEKTRENTENREIL